MLDHRAHTGLPCLSKDTHSAAYALRMIYKIITCYQYVCALCKHVDAIQKRMNVALMSGCINQILQRNFSEKHIKTTRNK